MAKRILALVSEAIDGNTLRNFLEEGLVDEATERFDPPVRHMVVE